MEYIDLAEAEANFEHYVERAQRGEDFAITRDGKPLVRLVAMLPRIGALKGMANGADLSFEALQSMDKEIEELFYASEIFPPEDGPTTAAEPGKSGDLDKGGQ
jgi:prevent-host-death family protein